LIFITLGRFRKKPTKEMFVQMQKLFEESVKSGGKILSYHWTLGRYDGIVISEAPDEKTLMKELLKFADFVSTETLVAVSAEDAGKLLE
jgi:uncharacterized protein with GYD domain